MADDMVEPRGTALPAPGPDWIVPDWDVPASIRAITSTRLGPGASLAPFDQFNLGTGSGDDPSTVAANRAELRRSLGLPSEPRWLSQAHGNAVAEFSAEPGPCPVIADAALTRDEGVVLAVLTADCLPILVAARDGREVAAIHAGWRGIAAGVIEAAIGRMHAQDEGLIAWLGPAIGPAHYEVGEEVRDAMLVWGVEAGTALQASRRGHWRCDLYALARLRLRALGVSDVGGGWLCTYADRARFYSYRRDGRTGRIASLIWMTDP